MPVTQIWFSCCLITIQPLGHCWSWAETLFFWSFPTDANQVFIDIRLTSFSETLALSFIQFLLFRKMKVQDRQNGPHGVPEKNGWLRVWICCLRLICSLICRTTQNDLMHAWQKIMACSYMLQTESINHAYKVEHLWKERGSTLGENEMCSGPLGRAFTCFCQWSVVDKASFIYHPAWLKINKKTKLKAFY